MDTVVAEKPVVRSGAVLAAIRRGTAAPANSESPIPEVDADIDVAALQTEAPKDKVVEVADPVIPQQSPKTPVIATVDLSTPAKVSDARQRLIDALAKNEQVLPPAKYRFVKRFGPADKIRFKDESVFQFPLIMRNGGSGYSSSSEFKTDDEGLASKLREVAKNPAYGIVEII